jgi:putative endopeptidase
MATLSSAHGINPASLDPSVPPCQDFFQYANGNWIKQNPIPADQSTWGAFNLVKERNRVILKAILEESAAAQAPAGSLRQKVGDFYASGMDTRAIDQAGLAPLKPAFDRIKAIRDGRDLAAALAWIRMQGGGAGFGFFVGQDDKRSTAYIAQFSQGGLGLPDRDYYTNTDEKSQDLRGKYLEHVARMFGLTGEQPRWPSRPAWPGPP